VILFKMLNQDSITKFLTVSQSNIVVGIDDTIDDKTLGDLENKTITEVMKKILKYSSSVMYIEDSVVRIADRSETSDLKHTFFGVGSLSGVENTIDFSDVRSGSHRVRNFITYKDTSLKSEDPTSIALNGVRKDEIEFKPMTDGTKRQNAIDNFRDEFKNKKMELTVTVPIDYATLALRRKDKVNFDFPVRFLSNDGVLLPLFGAAIYDDVDLYPHEISDIEIDQSKNFKIMDVDINTKNETISFECWEIEAS